jgi:hypothetical protein
MRKWRRLRTGEAGDWGFSGIYSVRLVGLMLVVHFGAGYCRETFV